MLPGVVKVIRVILVKPGHPLHKVMTLELRPEHTQERIAQETMDIYAPLATRLGIHWVKSELEDISFKYLNPEAYHDLKEQIAARRQEREAYVAKIRERVSVELEGSG